MVAKILEKFPELTENDVRSTSMGQTGMDVQLSEKARVLFPYAVECKNHARYAVYADFQQALDNAGNLTPLLVIKQNHGEPLVIMRLEDWIVRRQGD